jgi:hypothetical protein
MLPSVRQTPTADRPSYSKVSAPQLQPPARRHALRHPTQAPVALGIALGPAVAKGGAHVAPSHKIRLALGVVYEHLPGGRIPAHNQAPVAAAAGCRCGPMVEPAHGDGKPQAQQGDQLLDAAIHPEGGLDPQALQSCHLSLAVGGVAKAFHQGQVAIIRLAAPRQAARLEKGRCHGAGG